ncbi:LuxR family transcriptional regulator [Streptomyces fumigatiscleroticus]|nr:LuxR family transcriptional regulator [Streptomyces fumigatiscleroticus]
MNAQAEIVPLEAAEHRETPPPVASLSSLRRPARPHLVGRERELGELEEFLEQALAHGAARVVCGAAGSGKSELLEAGVELVTAAGLRVLRCTGVRGGTPPALSGLLQLMWPLVEDPLPAGDAGRIQALETLLLDGAADADATLLPFTVLGVLESAAAVRPLLLAVDDFDALDGPSREVLSFVARRTAGHAMAVLITSRPHRTRLTSLTGLPELALGPLTPDRSAALLALRRPGNDPQTARELLATAAGNPLALLELPVRCEDSVPHMPVSSDRLASAMAPGAARLPTATRDLLLVAALHPAGDLPLLLSAASRIEGTEPDFAVVEPAEREGLVVCEGTRLLFAHPAMAGAVVHGVGPRRCRAAHAALAAVLERDSVRHVWHLAQAAEGTDKDLAARLEAVHRRPLERGEPMMAVRLLRRAADLYDAPEDRGRCTLLAAQLAHDVGLERTARTLAHRALRHPLGTFGTLCAQALARREGGTGRQPWADPAAWPAPAGAREQDNALELARITAPEVVDDAERAEALLAFLDRMPDRAEDPRLLHAMATVGPVRRAATVIARLSAVRGLGLVPVRDLERMGEAALLAGAPLRALDLYRQAERRYRFQELADQLPRILLRQGLAHLLTGGWGQAERSFRQCVEPAVEHGRGHHAAAAALLGELVRGLRTGTVPGLGAHDLESARRSVHAIDDIVAVGTGWARVESGDFAGGYAALRPLLTDPGRAAVALFALVPFAEAADAAGTAGEARTTLHRLAAELGAERAPLVSVGLAVARAVLAEEQDADVLYEQAFASDLTNRPFLEASLRLAHGRLLRRRREFTDSRVTLRQAAATFSVMGAEARVARITAELRASGERTEAGAASGPRPERAGDLLSPQELRIARLAGQGLSNRQIGEVFGLSPRTIGAYLYRIFPRLGVTARTQLAEALREDRA